MERILERHIENTRKSLPTELYFSWCEVAREQNQDHEQILFQLMKHNQKGK